MRMTATTVLRTGWRCSGNTRGDHKNGDRPRNYDGGSEWLTKFEPFPAGCDQRTRVQGTGIPMAISRITTAAFALALSIGTAFASAAAAAPLQCKHNASEYAQVIRHF